MRTRVAKWGNSLALRIPKSFATEVGLTPDSQVELSLVDGKLVVAPAAEPGLSPQDLLTQVTQDSLHHEIDFGPAMGNEAW